MSSNNFFYNIYNKKETQELADIASGNEFGSDSRLVALSILKERDSLPNELIGVEDELIEKRDRRLGTQISDDRYRTAGARYVALLIDGILISLFSWLISRLSGLVTIQTYRFIEIFGLVLPYLYNIILHGMEGQTVGKMFMDVKVYDKSEKKVISFKQSILRDIVPISLLIASQFIYSLIGFSNPNLFLFLSSVMSFFILFWSLVEVISLLFNKKRRALHDFIAGTVVLRVKA